MAELTEFQVDWITKAAGTPIDDAALEKAAARQALREARSKQLIAQDLNAVKQTIADAQTFTITKTDPDTACRAMWKRVLGRPASRERVMKWHATDEDLQARQGLYVGESNKRYEQLQDIEVDTGADIIGIEAIPDGTLEELTDSFERILNISQQMERELDADGNRLYSDDDIMAELWTPLVRDGTIPENLVPNRFSETQRAIDGALDLYKGMLQDFTKKSRGNEKLMFGLHLLKDTASLGGKLATHIVTIQDAKELAEINRKYAKGEIDKETAEGRQLLTKKAELETKANFVKFGVAAMDGSMNLMTTVADETTQHDKANWTKVADKSLETLGKVAVAAVGPFVDKFVIGDEDKGTRSDRSKAVGAFSKALQACIAGSVASARMLPAAITAMNEDDPAKRRKAIGDAIDRFADAVGECFVIAAQKHFDNGPEKGAVLMWGAAAKSAIRGVGRADLVVAAIQDGKPREAAMRLGGAAVEGVMAGCAEALLDAMKKDVTDEDYQQASFFERQFMERTQDVDSTGAKTDEELADGTDSLVARAVKARREATAKLIETANAKIASVTEDAIGLLDQRTALPDDPAAEQVAAEVKAATEKMVKEKAEAEIAEFFGDKAKVAEMFAEFDEKIVGYEQIYADATGETRLDGTPPSEVEKSLAAIDAVMARTADLRARANMINGITSSATGVMAAIMPGGGAVAAVQKMVFDLYLLQRAVAAHNQWCESMELAFRANSAYGPAIRNTLHNAKITLSRKSIAIVLDALKVGSETARMFDPTGAATISSAAASISEALFDYGYKRWTEVEIARGWNAFKAARDNPRSRKAARNALRLNSTLAKCAIAYGAVVAGDTSAKEAIRQAGMSPGLLADDTDVCKRLIKFLEQELSDDPVVLQAEKLPHKWQPGRPELTPASWFEIKTMALTVAEPKLAKASAKTPGIDQILAKLAAAECWDGKATYAAWRADHAEDTPEAWAVRKRVATRTVSLLSDLRAQMAAYAPVQAAAANFPHHDMADIVSTYTALIRLMLPEAELDANAAAPTSPPAPIPEPEADPTPVLETT